MQKATYSWMSLCLIFGTGILCDENTAKQNPISIRSDNRIINTQNIRSTRNYCSIPNNNGTLYTKNPNSSIVLSHKTIVDDGTIVYVTCDEKYYKITSHEVIIACQSGKWLPPNLKICLKMCPPQNSDSLDTTCVHNGCTVDCTQQPSIPGTKLTAKCKDTHYSNNGIPENPVDLICHENGTWIGSIVNTCQPEPPMPVHDECKRRIEEYNRQQLRIPIADGQPPYDVWIPIPAKIFYSIPLYPYYLYPPPPYPHPTNPRPSPYLRPSPYSRHSPPYTQRPLYPKQFIPSPTERPFILHPSRVGTLYGKETITIFSEPDPGTPTPEVAESDIPATISQTTTTPIPAYPPVQQPKAPQTPTYSSRPKVPTTVQSNVSTALPTYPVQQPRTEKPAVTTISDDTAYSPDPDGPDFTGASSIRMLKAQCKEPRGQFPSKSSCNKFIDCWDDTVSEKLCYPAHLVFNPETRKCDFPFNVDCGSRPITGKT